MRQNQCIAFFIISSFLWVALINYYFNINSNARKLQNKLERDLSEFELTLDESENKAESLLKEAISIINNRSSDFSASSKTSSTEESKNSELETKIVHDENSIAILVISCNRVKVSRTLDQLIKYRPNKERFPIIVSQDCVHEPTSRVIRSYGKELYHVHQPDQSDIRVPPREKKFKGYFKIARHYKWALNLTFNRYNFSTTVIIEDDLDISPDFYEYFAATLPILRKDTSLWCVSAWNDNGKLELVDRNAVDLLYRTDFFPGLGWMLTKSLWNELLTKWPISYWDDWMREPTQRKNRSCIRPELSRTRTFGKIGVSNGLFYDKHLKYIYLNDKFAEFTQKNLSYLIKEAYDVNFGQVVYNSPIVNIEELKMNTIFTKGSVRILYDSKEKLKKIAKSIGLMDDFKSGVPRTAYMGIISFVYKKRRVFITPDWSFKGYEPN